MIDLECPSCGRAGSIPREKINTRLVCKNCHKVFHMNSTGRTLLGEPKVEAVKPERSRKSDEDRTSSLENLSNLRNNFSEASIKQLGAVLGGLIVLAGIWYILNRPAEGLESIAKETAEKFAADDLAYLKQIASSDTADDVVRWFDTVHPEYVKSRDQWKTKQTKVQVTVVDEDRKNKKGEARAFIFPDSGPAHTASIHSEADAAAGPILPMTLKLAWILQGGKWRLDGQQTLQAAGRLQ